MSGSGGGGGYSTISGGGGGPLRQVAIKVLVKDDQRFRISGIEERLLHAGLPVYHGAGLMGGLGGGGYPSSANFWPYSLFAAAAAASSLQPQYAISR